MSTDLVPWLRQQLDEDERGVREWAEPPPSPVDWLLSSPLRVVHELTDRVGKRRMLDEVDAKRRIVELHARAHECSVIDRGTINGEPYEDVDNCAWVLDGEECSTVRLLALPYADRPGYREEWRP